MEATKNRLSRTMGWIEFGQLTLRQISEAHLIDREFWERYAGARYPDHSRDSVFVTRPWDDGKRTPEQQDALIAKARRDLK